MYICEKLIVTVTLIVCVCSDVCYCFVPNICAHVLCPYTVHVGRSTIVYSLFYYRLKICQDKVFELLSIIAKVQ